MNNDATPIPAAALPDSTSTIDNSNDAGEPARTTRRNALSPAQKRFQAQITKKLEFIDDLTRHADMLIWMELCILYYMDCSFLRLFLRGFFQLIFLTPKPAALPQIKPIHRPWIYVIFGPNLICMILHIFTARPEAGESMRSYLHGGIIIDLIGQKGPTSKMHSFLLDILVMALQCFMLAVVMEKDRLANVMKAYASPNDIGNPTRTTVPTPQDHDAEERGFVRDTVTDGGDIELQAMADRVEGSSSPAAPDQNIEAEDDRARLLAEPPSREDRGDGLDTFWSGRAIIADFHILHIIRRHWREYGIMTGAAAESALQNVGFRAEVAAITANRGFEVQYCCRTILAMVHLI